MKRHLLCCAVIGFVLLPASARGQRPVPDSVAEASLVEALTNGIFPALSEVLTWDVVSANVDPWTVTVRDSANPRWQRVQRGLRLMLRQGISRSEQHRENRIVVERAVVRGDTAVMQLTVSQTWSPKPGCRVGSSMGYEVRSLRSENHWKPGVARPTIDGAPGVCP